jgi:hypothetical protein
MFLEALMKVPVLRFYSLTNKATLVALALGGLLLLAGSPAAKADDSDDCNRRVSYTERRYHEAVEHFGPYSSQARHWAHERHEAYEQREHCRHDGRKHHRDWDRH